MNILKVLSGCFIIGKSVSAASAHEHDIIGARRNLVDMQNLLLGGHWTADHALMESVDFGTPEVIGYLLDQGVDPNMVSSYEEDSNTPLTKAVSANNLENVVLLLGRGANPDIEDSMGMAPLTIACGFGNVGMVEALLQAGANPNCQTRRGHSPLHFAAGRENEQDIVDLLLAAGADVNILDNDNKTPLMIAAMRNQLQIVSKLISHNADLSIVSHEDGYNALDFAIKNSSTEVAELLETHGSVPSRH